jgi:hypothetical protein
MKALIPYAGSERASVAYAKPKIQGPPPKLIERLSAFNEDHALVLFRRGYDTVSVANLLECTPAAAANGLANARDRERRP